MALLTAGTAFLAKGCFNLYRSSNAANILRANVYDKVRAGYNRDNFSSSPLLELLNLNPAGLKQSDQTKYILKHTLAPDERLQHIVVKQSVTKHDPPAYVNFGKQGSFSVPIGGGSHEEDEVILNRNHVLLKNIIVPTGTGGLYSEHYQYYPIFMEHRKAVKYLMDKYKIDLSHTKVSNSMLQISEGVNVDCVYAYGSAGSAGSTPCNFAAETFSNNLDSLVNHIVAYPSAPYLFIGATCLFFAYII